MFRQFSHAVIVLLILSFFTYASLAREISSIEDFALAKDRAAALKQLIPGTKEYYYFHCLHYQNSGQFEKINPLMKLWIKRYGYTSRVREILNRQALLNYKANPNGTLGYLIKHLNVSFNHQRESLRKKTNLPTVLDPKLISHASYAARAYRSYSNIHGFEHSAHDWLITQSLNATRLRHLLSQLQRPDYANLPKLIIADLRNKHSRGFGSHAIHRKLLKSQMDELIKLDSGLLKNSNFVYTYLTKLHPNADVDPIHNHAERLAHLKRMWNFVKDLAPRFNSLKANVLYHRLVYDRTHGDYNKERFMTYLKLPRAIGYMRSAYLRSNAHRHYNASLSANYQSYTKLIPIHNDTKLVRSYLMHFFLAEKNYKPYLTWLNDNFTKHLFAETMIVNGVGDHEQWYSMIPPATYKVLKERVDLDFAYTNREVYSPDEKVSLDLFVKNVPTLIVKVYHINALNFYRANYNAINTNINLDGLVANLEKTYKYPEVALIRKKRTFTFDQLAKPGIYVIDFIGNGKSSRSLIRKGNLRYISRTTPAGHIFTVLDQRNRKLQNAKIWMAGREYLADQNGNIAIPYSTKPGPQSIILVSGTTATLARFNHESENYNIVAGIHVDREQLIKHKKATVSIRPALYINGVPTSLKLLKNVKLVISSTNHDGVNTTKDVPNFKIFEDRESLFEFQTPDRLRAINFTLTAKVKNISRNTDQYVSDSQAFSLNNITRTEKIHDLHFSKSENRFAIDVLGRSGEVKPDHPVYLTIKHKDFRQVVNATLQTDKNGRIQLGTLADIAYLTARLNSGINKTLRPASDRHTYQSAIHAAVGQTITIPFMPDSNDPKRTELSLLETRTGTFVNDHYSAIAINDGMLEIKNLPRGDYDLLIKPSSTRINIRVTQGETREGYVLAQNRQLQAVNTKPLQITSVSSDKENISIKLRNATKFSRVHIIATKYIPDHDAFAHLARPGIPNPAFIRTPRIISNYVTGRDIGDEYRYILDRKYARKFNGNMLTRPRVLLNPWAIRTTQTARQDAKGGNNFSPSRKPGFDSRSRGASGRGRAVAAHGGFPNYDYLADQSHTFYNIQPDKNGVISLKRVALGDRQHLHIVAVDPNNTVYRHIALPEKQADQNDLRLVKNLDLKKHYTQQKQVQTLLTGANFKLDNIATSDFESYDNLARIYTLYVTLSGNQNLVKFNFILKWNDLKPDQKRAKYSEYSCHELNFFLFRKDPEFFRKVVRPYIANKADKTFMDHFLLGNDLSNYLDPWYYNRLNIVERILLAQAIKKEASHARRHISDLNDLLVPNIDRINYLFDTAVKGSSLDANDDFDEARSDAIVDEKKNASKDMAALSSLAGLANARTKRPVPAASAKTDPRSIAPGKPDAKGLAYDKYKDAQKKRASEARSAFRRNAGKELAREPNQYFGEYAKQRRQTRRFYVKLDKTKEWVENNYYKLPIEQQLATLVTVNSFWKDYVNHQDDSPFLSQHFAEASRNFTEMMFALSVLDLPVKAAKHDMKFKDASMTLRVGSPAIILHKQIRPADPQKAPTLILVSQNFFRHGDRYRYVNNERHDKYITDEFIINTVYGCQVVLTNPTSTRQKLDILTQIPRGAIPLINGHYTRSRHIDLQPYRTQTIEYYFYFPTPGQFPQFPVHVAKNEKIVKFADPITLNVVAEPTKIDKTSWAYISQFGTEKQVFDYLKANNINRLNLNKIAFRMKDVGFFDTAIALLNQRHVYHNTLFSYSLKHNKPNAINQYLLHQESFLRKCGMALASPLVTIHPVERNWYQHMEYSPLVNARAHQLSKRRQIVNDRFYSQYHQFLRLMTYRNDFTDNDLMGATYYMALQDRVDEAMAFFKRVNPNRIKSRIQYDYLTAYLDFFNDEPQLARGIAEQYKSHPVDKWRKLFTNIATQLDEIEGKNSAVVDVKDRTQQQTKLASTAPNIELKVEAGKVAVNYQNVNKATVNYYLMDLELLFSRNPFVQQHTGHFAYIKPNFTQSINLPIGKHEHTFDLPKQFQRSNVMVEIVSAGQRKSQAYYAHSLLINVMENYGQVKVADRKNAKALSKVYIKVYAQLNDGRVRFYKDGYTDLRGRFDYTSLNTNEIDNVRKFSILILTDTHGALVKEATPPKR